MAAVAAALLARLVPFRGPAGGSLLPAPLPNVAVVRFVSWKRGCKPRNYGRKRAALLTGLKKHNGEFVHSGNVLATQRVIRWHPGAHVGTGGNNTLYALEDGQVRFTKEIYVPPPLSKETEEMICPLPKRALLYKTFINVVPKDEVGSFKLVKML